MRSTPPSSQPEPTDLPRRRSRRYRRLQPADGTAPTPSTPRRARASFIGRITPLFIIVIGASLAVRIAGEMREYEAMQARVEEKKQQLAALESQHEVGQRRLAVLRADKTHKSVLIEHGYIRPGDRILLFPRTAEEEREARLPKNDLAPHPPLDEEQNAPSLWQRAASRVGSWLGGGKATDNQAQSASEEPTSATPPASAPPGATGNTGASRAAPMVAATPRSNPSTPSSRPARGLSVDGDSSTGAHRQ